MSVFFVAFYAKGQVFGVKSLQAQMFLQSCVKKIAKTKFWRFRLQLPTHFAILQFFVFDTFYLQCCNVFSPAVFLSSGFIPLLFCEKVCVCKLCCNLPDYTVTRYTLHCAYHGNNRKECRNTVFAKCPPAKTIRDLMSFPPFPPRQRILCLPRRKRQNTNCLFGH